MWYKSESFRHKLIQKWICWHTLTLGCYDPEFKLSVPLIGLQPWVNLLASLIIFFHGNTGTYTLRWLLRKGEIICLPHSDDSDCCCCLVAKLCLTLRDLMDSGPPGSSDHGISQARILEWVAISFSRGYSWPRDWTCGLAHRFFTMEPPGTHTLITEFKTMEFLLFKPLILWQT